MGIVWIASYPRSGNTWLRAVIGHLKNKGPVAHGDYGKFVPHEAAAIWYGQFEGIEDAEAGPTRQNIERRRQVQEQLAASFDGGIAYLKTHNALVQLEGLPLLRDDITAGAVYIARDPRDVAVSIAATQNISHDDAIDLLSNKNAWTGPRGKMGRAPMFEFLGNWSEHVKSWARAKSPIVRYEDLFERFDAYELIRASCYINVKESEVEAAREDTSFALLREREAEVRAAKDTPEPPIFRVGEREQWKTALTPGQAKRIEFNHRDVMRRLNYL